MFSHIFVSVTDFDRAFSFYSALMEALGVELRFRERGKPWAGWHSAGRARPLFVICKPQDGQLHHPGNGQMVAFMAADRALVRATHQIALAHGAAVKARQGYGPSTMPIITAHIFVIQMATKFALLAMRRIPKRTQGLIGLKLAKTA